MMLLDTQICLALSSFLPSFLPAKGYYVRLPGTNMAKSGSDSAQSSSSSPSIQPKSTPRPIWALPSLMMPTMAIRRKDNVFILYVSYALA
jgi:hypothetical protein